MLKRLNTALGSRKFNESLNRVRETQKMLSGKGKLQHRMHDAICIKHTQKMEIYFCKGRENFRRTQSGQLWFRMRSKLRREEQERKKGGKLTFLHCLNSLLQGCITLKKKKTSYF